MMLLTTKIFDALGLNRDSLSLFWAKWIAFIVALAPMGMDVTKYGIPAKWVPFIQLAALFISVSSAQHRTSDLPGDAQPPVSGSTLDKIAKSVPAILLACLLGGAAALSLPACASTTPPPTKAAAVADHATKIQQSANVILHEAQQANAVLLPNGRPLVSEQQLVDVALIVNRVGHLGLDLKHALDDYAAALKAGGDIALQRAVASKVLGDIVTTLQDVGKSIPGGTIRTIDQAITDILFVVDLVKEGSACDD